MVTPIAHMGKPKLFKFAPDHFSKRQPVYNIYPMLCCVYQHIADIEISLHMIERIYLSSFYHLYCLFTTSELNYINNTGVPFKVIYSWFMKAGWRL